ncbi:MAG: hypothetical protein WC464_03330 [Bdellovibrionales bacterium]
MPSSLYEYIDEAPSCEVGSDYVVKSVNAAKAIMSLPNPKGIGRAASRIPDIPIKVILSTTPQVPEHIIDILKTSKCKNFLLSGCKCSFLGWLWPSRFSNSLYGLCLNGRGMPPKIFVHREYIDGRPNAEELFEEVFWHETVHGAEGIVKRGHRFRRMPEPWSFRVQNLLLKLDEETNDSCMRLLSQRPINLELYDYMRCGLDVQGNVSELFADVAVLMLRHIRNGGELPRTPKAVHELFAKDVGNGELPSQKQPWEVQRIKASFILHGSHAREMMWYFFPEMLNRTALMYGCNPPLRLPRRMSSIRPHLVQNGRFPG